MAGKTKQSKGSVGVEVFQRRLRLRLPRELFEGKQKYLTLGLSDTKVNRKLAEMKKAQVVEDILKERFDLTLAKYKPSQSQSCHVLRQKQPGIPQSLGSHLRSYCSVSSQRSNLYRIHRYRSPATGQREKTLPDLRLSALSPRGSHRA